MNLDECRALCGYINKIRPSQEMDDDTPKAWVHVLAGVTIADARVVVIGLARDKAWVDPHEIVAASRRLRRARLAEAGFDELTPNVDPDDTAGWVAERRALRDAIASGAMSVADVRAYERAEVPPLTGAAPWIEAGQQLTSKPLARVLAAAAKRRAVPS